MNSIDPSKIITELTRSNAEINKDISKEISTKLSSAMSEKQRSAIGLLLKKTLDNLSQSGLLSIDTQKAVLRARQILPAEFTQIYIQDRVVQHKLAQAAIESATITPRELTIGTLQQWFQGQVIQADVDQELQPCRDFSVNLCGDFTALTAEIELGKEIECLDNRHCADFRQCFIRDKHMPCGLIQTTAMTGRAGLLRQVFCQFLADHVGFGFAVATFHVGNDALEGVGALEDVSPVIHIGKGDFLFARAVQNSLLMLFAQFVKGRIDIEFIVLRQ